MADVNYQGDTLSLQEISSGKLYRLLPNKEFLIGRDPICDLCIQKDVISWHHASIERKGLEYLLTDLASSNGIFLNGVRMVPKNSEILYQHDIIEFGDMKLNCLFNNPITNNLKSLQLSHDRAKDIFIGRSPECDIILKEPSVSWKHAVIRIEPNGWHIEDLNSTNGTFVNERQIQSASLTSNDRIHIGLHSFNLMEDSMTFTKNDGGILIEAEGLIQIVWHNDRPLTLLNNVSVSILPGELTAIIGASGAGKTTLLQALNGYNPAARGKVLLNGINLYSHPDIVRTWIGYVPQTDIIHSDLNVESVLRHAARLRLPSDTSENEIVSIVNQTLIELNINHCRQSVIRKLSGGERKRVNIGVELLNHPSVLFLDEPTTGLDAGLERQITKLLRSVASEGRTIITVTHSIQTLDDYDRLIWMARGGKLAYSGAPKDALVHFGVKDYASVYDLLTEKFAQHQEIAPFLPDTKKSFFHAENLGKTRFSDVKQHSPMLQTSALISRYWEIVRSDTRNLIIWLAQAPIVALIIVCMFHSDTFSHSQSLFEHSHFPIQDGPRILFIIAFSMTCFGLCNACREIIKEKSIYDRERHVFLGAWSYLLSKIAILGIVAFCQSLFLLSFVNLFINFNVDGAHMVVMFIILFLGAMTAVLIGLWVSAWASSPDQAITIVALIMLLQVIFSGLIPLEQMNSVLQFVVNLNSMRWCYGGLCGTVNMVGRWSDAGLESPAHDVFHTTAQNAIVILNLMLLIFLPIIWRFLIRNDNSRI